LIETDCLKSQRGFKVSGVGTLKCCANYLCATMSLRKMNIFCKFLKYKMKKPDHLLLLHRFFKREKSSKMLRNAEKKEKSFLNPTLIINDAQASVDKTSFFLFSLPRLPMQEKNPIPI
jgi:hypothetical protein